MTWRTEGTLGELIDSVLDNFLIENDLDEKRWPTDSPELASLEKELRLRLEGCIADWETEMKVPA